MCTALTFTNGDCYFGRTLDLEYNYNEEIVVTPRKFQFRFRNGSISESHVSIIGVAVVSDGYPLYYEATNESGLSISALNFNGYSVYSEKNDFLQKLSMKWSKFSNRLLAFGIFL